MRIYRCVVYTGSTEAVMQKAPFCYDSIRLCHTETIFKDYFYQTSIVSMSKLPPPPWYVEYVLLIQGGLCRKWSELETKRQHIFISKLAAKQVSVYHFIDFFVHIHHNNSMNICCLPPGNAIVTCNKRFNSSPRQWIGSASVQIMACPLFGAKPLSKPMLDYCELDPS